MTDFLPPPQKLPKPKEPVRQAICNKCGATLEVMEVDKLNKYPYKCPQCGAVPSFALRKYKQSKIAMSYNMTPKRLRKKEQTL